MTKPLKIIILTISIIAISGLSYWGYHKIFDFFAVDSCLDSGGNWNEEKKEYEHSFDLNVLNMPKYAGGLYYGTDKRIKPEIFQYEKYTLVKGFDTNMNSTLGLYYENREIFSPNHTDGMYDTIMIANLNNDGVPDFLVSYQFEDGASLMALISKNKLVFNEVLLFEEWQSNYCKEDAEMLMHLIPILIEDINTDGMDDIIINLAKKEGRLFAISCSDTVLANQIK